MAESGAIILVRHGRPALSRKVTLSATDYRDWWAQYEVLGLREGQTAPDRLKTLAREAGTVLASTRLRSIESATLVCDGRPFLSEAALIEAPLPPPPWPSWLKLPPTAWGFISRFAWWWFDFHSGEEPRRQAEMRAEAMVDRLVELAAGGEDVLVVAHGFFNAMIGRALRRRGWRLTENGGYKYWGARRFAAPALTALHGRAPPGVAAPAALADQPDIASLSFEAALAGTGAHRRRARVQEGGARGAPSRSTERGAALLKALREAKPQGSAGCGSEDPHPGPGGPEGLEPASFS